jgi:tRNA nucleotidyltransferase (CCA-adding enzyme)
LSDDFSRRDFTVNAMALHLIPDRWGQWEDPFNGRQDLRAGLVRALHEKSFVDDPTRIHRAARYAGRYGWKVEPFTLRWLKSAIKEDRPALLSPARLRAELEKVLGEADPRAALTLLWKWGTWRYWSPGWMWSRFLESALAPAKDGGKDVDSLLFRLMALNRSHPAQAIQQDLSRLEFPRSTVEAVKKTTAALEALENNRLASPFSLTPTARHFLKLALKNKEVLQRWERSTPVLNGKDLKTLGYTPGPAYQEILESLRLARWQGRVRSREDEIRHVVDNFPRKI